MILRQESIIKSHVGGPNGDGCSYGSCKSLATRDVGPCRALNDYCTQMRESNKETEFTKKKKDVRVSYNRTSDHAVSRTISFFKPVDRAISPISRLVHVSWSE